MRAVILAGGESSRFWPLNKCHKSLLEIAGKPLIVRTINNLPRAVEEVVVIESPGGCVSKTIKNYSINKQLEFRVQDKPRGMWDAILIGARDYGDDVIVASGHQFSPFAFEQLTSGRGTKLLLSRVKNPKDYGVAKIEGDRVTSIDEKPKVPKSDTIVNSIYRLSQDFVKTMIPRGSKKQYFFEKALSTYLKDNPAKFEIIPKEEIPSLKYPWDALSVTERILDEIPNKIKGDVSESANLSGNVFVEEGASIAPDATIQGPVYIGKGAFVGTSSLVRQSSIEMGSVVGFGSEVARSLMGPESKVHHCFVGDSVLGRGTWFGFGTIVANRRFDKKVVVSVVKRKKRSTGRGHFGCATGEGARVGVGSKTMPGIFLGADVVVGPGTIVDKNLPNGKKMYVKQTKVVK
ncbi:MAG: NTP transferase domain-containing protein [Candidatus Altiarchaeota archaeon]|nr:NTP transferase domain-containing protein [Candidatus Altiarchaeota archaeon]